MACAHKEPSKRKVGKQSLVAKRSHHNRTGAELKEMQKIGGGDK